MKLLMTLAAVAAFAAAPIRAAETLPDDVFAGMSGADVVILGETHDNPSHHLVQADAITRLNPAAVVWEMLDQETAAGIPDLPIEDPEALALALDWAHSGWPDFAIYYPVFRAAATRPSYGGLVPRQAAFAVAQDGPQIAVGEDGVSKFGLDQPLPEAEMAQRVAGQMAAHCDAMGHEMMPMMVQIQRVRDARLAQATMQALEDTGGPVVVITGNGHARKDWGVPVYLEFAAPQVTVFSLGQSEEGAISGVFDAVVDGPRVDRPDPCAVFRHSD